MSESAGAAITKYHKRGIFNYRELFLTALEARKSKMEAVQLPCECSLSGLQTAAFSPCPHNVDGKRALVSSHENPHSIVETPLS